MTTWVARTLPLSGTWGPVAFGNGVFVAACFASPVITSFSTSVDGSVWTPLVHPPSWVETTLVNYITFGNGIFVTSAAHSGVYTLWSSPDGITWTQRATAQAVSKIVLFANGMFINSDGAGAGVIGLTSTDGMTWTTRSNTIYGGGSVTFSNAIAGATGAVGVENQGYGYFSNDGYTWVRGALIGNTSAYQIGAYGNGVFMTMMMGNSSGSFFISSSNGSTWQDGTLTTSTLYPNTLCYGNGQFVVSDSNTTALMFTDLSGTPHITATSTTLPSSQIWYHSAYGNDQFLLVPRFSAAAATYNSPRPQVTTLAGTSYTAFSGSSIPPVYSWVETTMPLSSQFIAFGNGIFVAVSSGGLASTSLDGYTWTTAVQASPSTNPVGSIVFGNGMFVINTTGTVQLWSSPNGVTWTQRATAQTASIRPMHFANGIFMSTSGVTGNSLTSTDGITWTTRSTSGIPTADNPSVFCSGPSGLVGISGTNGHVYSTADGFTWAFKSTAPLFPTNSGVYGNGVYTAVYQNPSTAHTTIIRSPDAVTWTTVTPSVDLNYSPVVLCFGNGLFVGIGSFSSSGLLFPGFDFTNPVSSALPNATISSGTYGNNQFVLCAGSAVLTYYSPPPQYTIVASSSTGLIGTALTPGTMIDTSPTATTAFVGEARLYRDLALSGGSTSNLIGGCYTSASLQVTATSAVSLVASALASGMLTSTGDSSLTATGKWFAAALASLPGLGATSLIGTANQNVLANLTGSSTTTLPAKSTATTLLSAPGGSTISLVGKSTAKTGWGSSSLASVSLIGVGMGIGLATIAGSSATNLPTRVIAVGTSTWLSSSATNLLGKSTATTTQLITASSALSGLARATAASPASLPGSSTFTPVSGALVTGVTSLARPVSHLTGLFRPIPRTATVSAALPSNLGHGTATFTPVPLFASVNPALPSPVAVLTSRYSPAPLSLTAHPTLRRPTASGRFNIASAINCFVWGAQIEAGPAMTSYIPTAGSTASRAADFLQVASVESPLAITLNALVLCGLAQAILGYTPRTSNEATDTLNQYITLFDATIAPASNLHWVKTVSSLTELRTQVLSYLQQQIAVEPTVVTQTFGDSLPDVVAAYAVYGDANRAKELVSANDPVNPLYMPASFEFINA